MKIFDKANWQIDAGMSKELVFNHFEFISNWLSEKGLVSEEGEEILKLKIGDDFSLNENLLSAEGIKFLNMYYDELIQKSGYDTEIEKVEIENQYKIFLQINHS